MKKIAGLLLAVIVCLSLVACAGGETNDNSSIDQQDSTISEPQENRTDGTANTVAETIEITTDNWRDHFEIKDTLNVSRVKNDFGEQERMFVSIITALVPVFDTTAYIGSFDSELVIEYNVDFVSKDITFNTQTMAYELRECTCGSDAQASAEDSIQGEMQKIDGCSPVPYFCDLLEDGKVITQDKYYFYGFEIPEKRASAMLLEQDGEYTEHIERYPVNIVITRIEGTIVPNE